VPDLTHESPTDNYRPQQIRTTDHKHRLAGFERIRSSGGRDELRRHPEGKDEDGHDEAGALNLESDGRTLDHNRQHEEGEMRESNKATHDTGTDIYTPDETSDGPDGERQTDPAVEANEHQTK
jgi:hypothetical protein